MDEMKDVNENGVSSDIAVSEEKAPETAKKSSLTKKDIKTLIITGSVLVVLFWVESISSTRKTRRLSGQDVRLIFVTASKKTAWI